jgi:hypothetical protein
MYIKYPDGFKDADKLAYVFKLKQSLIDKHNEMGDLYKKGRITSSQWNTFLSEVFEKKRDIIMSDIFILQDNIIKDENMKVDFDKDFKE